MADKPRPAGQLLEMRRYPRYRLEARVAITAPRAEGPLHLEGRLRDISEGGLGCVLTGELLEGESVSVEFTLPLERQPSQARAVIRHRAGFHYGMEFVLPTPELQESIRRRTRTLPKVA